MSTTLEKYFRVAPYMKCLDHSGGQNICACEGWRNSFAFVSDEESAICACKHKLTAHGLLHAMKADEFDRVVGVVHQIEQCLAEAQRVIDPIKKQKLLETASQFRQMLNQRNHNPAQSLSQQRAASVPVKNVKETAPSESIPKPINTPMPASAQSQSTNNTPELNAPELMGNPPFEKPTIGQIMKNFIDLKFGKNHDIIQKLEEKVVKPFYNCLNKLELSPPATSSNPYEVSATERINTLNFKRWKFYCRGKKGQQFKLQDIFGKTMLKMLYKDVKLSVQKLSAETDQVSAEFYKLFDKELSNENSSVFLEAKTEEAEVESKKRKSEAPVTTSVSGDSKKSKSEEASTTWDLSGQLSSMLNAEGEIETKARDEKARKEERQGFLRFHVCQNDRESDHMVYLTFCKNIFSRQLPKMPKDYICRLVYDRNHYALCMIKSEKVVGAITFRPFKKQGFLEIAFLAVTASEQVKGYGTHLMNHLKHHAQSEGVYHFLTYADNFAIGYFKKQGFTKKISLNRKQWHGYIKDYEGGTLMECVIHPRIPYLKIPEMVNMQRRAVYEKIKEICNSHVKHKGLEHKFEKGVVRIDDIPGIKESGYVPTKISEEEKIVLHKTLKELLQKVRDHPSAWPFLKPVDPHEVPDYYDIVKDPIDLTEISRRMETVNYYITREIFLADIQRMCTNCKNYNNADTQYYKCAVALETEFLKKPEPAPADANIKQ